MAAPSWNPKPNHVEEGERADALMKSARGRGAQLNPGNRFESVRLHVLGDHLDHEIAEDPDAARGQQVKTAILDDETKSVINHVESPDIGFSWSLNPYRGCEHGCIYCY